MFGYDSVQASTYLTSYIEIYRHGARFCFESDGITKKHN